MRRFVIGDIHGAYKALMQCLEKSGFDYDHDLLICLGDICDGWPQTRECIDELLNIKNCTVILGNHDQWALQWMKDHFEPNGWIQQGGMQTKNSYIKEQVPSEHIDLLENAKLYHVVDNKLFVHAGIDPSLSLEKQDEFTLLWARDFFTRVAEHINSNSHQSFTEFDEVYIGHTPIHRLGYFKPVSVGEVWLMDTGAAWQGTLSLMDIDSKEVYVSEKPMDLYPEGSGRF